ncbi:MAG TPA: tetratricopeptide repeat protein [Chthonomonadaceae bacterium]|nr:tetratricopeptide repeat protein [Chthonomonadaceae bacterium]
MAALPSGTVTFLFTDIAGSTKLWQEYPDSMPSVLARHDELLRTAIEQNHGFVVKTIGDAFMAAFSTAHEGVNAALTAQRSLCAEPWPQQTPIRVRMGLHTGVTEERNNDYFGHEVNRAARIQAVVHPQQIVLSQVVHKLIQERLPEAATLLDLGLHHLKDLREPENLWQLCHPELPASFPPLNSLTHWPNNLPIQLSGFIGREKEMAEVKELLARCSCLTLTGSGGCGKTRLALQVAADVLPDFPHGVWLVELAALPKASLVVSSVLQALNLKEEPGKPLRETLIEYLKMRQVLLVLDNCEHLVDACADLVEDLLAHCPGLRLLATSREELKVAGERLYRVPSLALPDLRTPSVEKIGQSEAGRLFAERSQEKSPSFVLTGQNAASIARICHRLDGIPLALELAAARVGTMPVEQIASRLDDRFRLLTGGSRTKLARHQTLRSLIDWSYDLLSPSEQRLLARLSVFSGGWTLEAAEQVCSGEGIEEWEVLDLLTGLVSRSLVVYEERVEGIGRYRLLETVRQYAREKLRELGEEAALQQRHGEWCLALVEEADPNLRGPEQGAWLERLESEHDNLREALSWSLVVGRSLPRPMALLLCGMLQRFWWTRGYLAEGLSWCRSALEAEGGQERTADRAKTLNGAGVLALNQGDYASARTYLESSLQILREIGDRQGIATSLFNLGNVAGKQGDYASARSYHEQSLEIFRELGYKVGIAASLINLGNVAYFQGDYASAHTYYEQSLEIRREIGDRQGIATSLINLGNVVGNQGDYASARSYFEQSLEIKRELGDRQGIATSLISLGNVAYFQGDNASARTYYEQSLEIQREIGNRAGIATSLGNLGNVSKDQGDYASARSLYEEALSLSRELGHRAWEANNLDNLGQMAYEQGDYTLARSLHEQSLGIRRELGDKRGIANSLNNLGQMACDQGDYASAQALYEESLGIRRELGDRWGIALSLDAFASLALKEKGGERAVRLWGVASTLREEIGSPLPPNDLEKQERELAAARETLGEDAFSTAWEEGRAMTIEQAITYALGE